MASRLSDTRLNYLGITLKTWLPKTPLQPLAFILSEISAFIWTEYIHI